MSRSEGASTPEDAFLQWVDSLVIAGWQPGLPPEEIALDTALGRISAQPSHAVRSSPAFDAAAMDGVAVRSNDTQRATDDEPVVLRRGVQAAPIDTGDPIPAGFDAVIASEDIRVTDDGIEITSSVPTGRHIRSAGEDFSEGDLLIAEGRRLRPVDIGILAAGGITRPAVRNRPRVVIIPSGDEIIPATSRPTLGQIPDSNSPMIAAQLREVGAAVDVQEIVPDDRGLLVTALSHAAANADLIVMGAGTSHGSDDHTASIIEEIGTLSVHGVAVRPGHPVVLGHVLGTPVIGVPGYPAAAWLVIELFALPILARLEGTSAPKRHCVQAKARAEIRSPQGVTSYVRVRLGSQGGSLTAEPLPGGAGMLTSLVRADGLLVVPASTGGLDVGATAEVLILKPEDRLPGGSS